MWNIFFVCMGKQNHVVQSLRYVMGCLRKWVTNETWNLLGYVIHIRPFSFQMSSALGDQNKVGNTAFGFLVSLLRSKAKIDIIGLTLLLCVFLGAAYKNRPSIFSAPINPKFFSTKLFHGLTNWRKNCNFIINMPL